MSPVEALESRLRILDATESEIGLLGRVGYIFRLIFDLPWKNPWT